MGPRKRNMLEALAASEREPAESPVFPGSGSAPSRAIWPGTPTGLSRSTGLVLGSLVAALVLGAAYWLGRSTATVEAGGRGADQVDGPVDNTDGLVDHRDQRAPSGTPSSSAESESRDTLSGPSDEGVLATVAAVSTGSDEESDDPPGTAGDGSAASDLTADDLRFFDKSNRFTVRAIYYGNTPRGWQRALATYRYLRELGLPAVAPIDQGNELVLCVGAEPKREDRLSEYRSRLRALPGPPPSSETGAFAGAYFVNIDDLVER